MNSTYNHTSYNILDVFNPFPNKKIQTPLDWKSLQTTIFKFDENDRTFFKQVEKKWGKRRNCWLPAISPFPTAFSKDLTVYNGGQFKNEREKGGG